MGFSFLLDAEGYCPVGMSPLLVLVQGVRQGKMVVRVSIVWISVEIGVQKVDCFFQRSLGFRVGQLSSLSEIHEALKGKLAEVIKNWWVGGVGFITTSPCMQRFVYLT